ncbi:TPA: DUF438 domain-containing protein [Candidatus Poribacteria bacterium]|nr:DUF438 domain-containing protein [Candidatus Poribacteria bacterium]
MIRRLHEGADPNEMKEQFRDLIKELTPDLIAQVEEELIREGMPREEIQRLCDVHLAVFRESLERGETLAPEGHPIRILMEEHKILLRFSGDLRETAQNLRPDDEEGMDRINHIVEHLRDSESHYLREENVLFPYLERHGITQPPAIMWMEHDRIREIKKNIYRLVDGRGEMGFQDFKAQLREGSLELAEMLSNHFYKENNILFPTALRVMEEKEWPEIRRQFDEIGYCCFTPQLPEMPAMEEERVVKAEEGMITFETGSLSREEIEWILNSLPVDITFVDRDDTVRYFNQSKDRIFVRTKAVIGRKVQQCHPQKSIHLVNKILEEFKTGKRDEAEFWIQMGERLIHIRYFPVRSGRGEYLGCIEVTQDITDIKRIEGEKRLL